MLTISDDTVSDSVDCINLFSATTGVLELFLPDAGKLDVDSFCTAFTPDL